MLPPGLVGLDRPEGVEEVAEFAGKAQPADFIPECVGYLSGNLLIHAVFLAAGKGRIQRVDPEQAYEFGALRVVAEQNSADAFIGFAVACEPSHRVAGGRERHRMVHRNAAMAGAQSDQAAECRGKADRAVGVGAERKIAQAARDGRRRSGRGSAGDAVARPRIHRMGEMRVHPDHRIGQFLGLGLADKPGPRIKQRLHDRRRDGLVAAFSELGRIAAAGRVALDVENVLHAEGKARKRAVGGTFDGNLGVVEKSVQRVFRAEHRPTPSSEWRTSVSARKISTTGRIYH